MRTPVAWYVGPNNTNNLLVWLENGNRKEINTGCTGAGRAIDGYIPHSLGNEFDVVVYNYGDNAPSEVVPYTRVLSASQPVNGSTLLGKAMYNVSYCDGAKMEDDAVFIVLRVDDEDTKEAIAWKALKTLLWMLS